MDNTFAFALSTRSQQLFNGEYAMYIYPHLVIVLCSVKRKPFDRRIAPEKNMRKWKEKVLSPDNGDLFDAPPVRHRGKIKHGIYRTKFLKGPEG